MKYGQTSFLLGRHAALEVRLKDQVFSDGLGAITSVAGTVRLDLVSYSPTEKDAKGQPLLVFCQRVVMPVEAFLLAAEKIHEVARAIRPVTARPREEASGPERPAGPVLIEPAPAPAPAPAVPPARPFP
jgi:hypothetical protein